MKTFLEKHTDIGILLLRVGVGLGFVFVHGWGKISAGPELWVKIGGSMSNLGIVFFPVFWGFMSSLAEFAGGILITLGLFTRTAALFLIINMTVAITQHLTKLDPWSKAIYPIEIVSVFLALLIIGAGKYSLDNLLFKKK
jgi:putative oxidoreductase